MVALVPIAVEPNEPNAPDLRSQITIEAIGRYEAARLLYDRVAIAAARDDSLARWEEVTRVATDAAERMLLLAILARDESIPGAEIENAVLEAHRPQAFRFEGRIYVAASDPELSPGFDDDGRQVVRLVVLEAKDLAGA